MAEVPSRYVQTHSFFHSFEENEPEFLFTDIEPVAPTVTGTISKALHNCFTHPVSGALRFVGDSMRLASPKTIDSGRRLVALADAIHDLF